jgi:hypothetical protein
MDGQYDNSSVDAVLTAVAHFAKNVNDPKAGKAVVPNNADEPYSHTLALLLYFGNLFTDGTITPFVILNPFYNGPSLPNSTFGEFLAIPATQTNLSVLSYYDVSNFLGDVPPPPVVEFFGASVLEGSDDVTPYREIYALYTELCQEFKDELAETTLAFSVVQNSQIAAGRAKGGNAIDAPHGGYYDVQFSLTLPPGPTNISPGLAAARQTFFDQSVAFIDSPPFLSRLNRNLGRLGPRVYPCISVKAIRTSMCWRRTAAMSF